MRRSVRSLGCCLVAVAAVGCSDDGMDMGGMGGQGGSGAAAAVTFTADIHPILTMKCSGQQCHSVANFIQPGHASTDVNLAYMEATSVGSNGAPIYERILLRVSSASPNNMPPSYAVPPCEGGLDNPGCVTQAEFDLIQEWVDQGHPK